MKFPRNFFFIPLTYFRDTGLRDLRYGYVVLDDCRSEGRGDNGYLTVDKADISNGMKSLSDRLDDHGLLFDKCSSAGKYASADLASISDTSKKSRPIILALQLHLATMKLKMQRAFVTSNSRA